MIGKENIEEKIFDYFEGNLSSSEAKELQSFIQKNPEYQVDFDAWEQSTVPEESFKYKFTNELLINEKKAPRGWLRWASGGVLICLISFGSLGLVNNYSSGGDKISTFKENSDLKNKSGINFKKNKANKVRKLLKESDVLPEENLSSVFKSSVYESMDGDDNKELVVQSKSLKLDSVFYFNLNRQSKASVTKSKDAEKNEKFDLSIKQNFKKLKSSNKQEIIKKINIESFKENGYSFHLKIPLRKVKNTYENPNHPKIFITNRKDPYLNYALAHTLEENGSFAGNGEEGIRTEMLYRTEWPSVSSENFTSQIISLDGRVDALKGGVGVVLNMDRIGHGKLNANSASLIYSPKILVRGVSFEPSFKYTYNQKNISWNQVDENDVKDPRNGILYASIPFLPEEVNKTTISHHDLGIGILINTDKFFFGGQMDHLNNPTYIESIFDQKITIPTKISLMAGTDLLKKEDGSFTFSPSFNFVKHGNYTALWTNTQFSYYGFFFVGGFATNEELMASLGYGNGKVRLAYGLGFTKASEFSGLKVTDTFYESHQISLRVHLQPKKR
jgi:type IX secretion system PorP/SprF family membrane protein